MQVQAEEMNSMSSFNVKGHILINSFLRTEKFMEHYRWLEKSAKKCGVQLSVIANADIFVHMKQAAKKRLHLFLKEIHFLFTGTRIYGLEGR